MTRWSDYTDDPASADAMTRRVNAVRRARSKELIADRVDYLCSLATDKEVLDVGVVGHTREAMQGTEWLHGRLSQCAKQCVGVDVLEEEVAWLRGRGMNVICCDLSKAPLESLFDLIVCGELIEHVDAPGPLLKNLARMLKRDGRVVFTTPNPWYLNVIVKNAIGLVPFSYSSDHVMWLDAVTFCELGERSGLALDKYAGVRALAWHSILGRIFTILQPALIWVGLNRECLALTIVYEFILAGDQRPEAG